MKKSMAKQMLILLMLFFIMTMTACKSNVAPDAVASGPFDSETITIHGLEDEDFTISLGDLKELPAVTQHAEATRANGEKISVDATGPFLDTFLQKYGKTQQDLAQVRFTAKDQYSIAIPGEILKNRSIILSYINDGQALPNDWQPIRIVIPGERAMYWVKDVIRIDFETGDESKLIRKVVFLESAAGNLPQEDYQYNDSVDKAIKTRDLITKYADINDSSVSNILIKASDGLQKNETKANFLEAFIKITGKEAPKFIAPQFPEGMHVRDILFIIYGETAVFDYKEGLACMTLQKSADKKGIALSQIIKITGLTGGNQYKFTSTTGQSIALMTTDLGNGLVYLNDRGTLGFISTGASGSKSIDALLSIEVLP